MALGVRKFKLTTHYRWKDAKNVYRVDLNVNNVPTLVRYQRVDGTITETGRLVEGQILDRDRLQDFLISK